MPEDTATAIRFYRNGGPDVLMLETVPLAQPGRRQVLVRHEAIGVNFIDTYHRSGLYEIPLPSGLGSEAAGVVEAIGEGVTDFRIGDRVGSFSGPLGAYSSHRLIDQDHLIKLPDTISSVEAAAAMLKGCTAEYLIERCAQVRAGDAVLVHAAAGGVGSILVQWLKAIGAFVIAHAGDQSKAALAAGLGADHSLSCPVEELSAEVRRLTGGEGVRVAFDGVGKATWNATLGAVARRGMVVSYGNASGAVPPVSLLDLMRAGSLFVTRPTLSDYCASVSERRAASARLFELMGSSAIKLQTWKALPLAEAAEAHRAIEGRATRGSMVLIP